MSEFSVTMLLVLKAMASLYRRRNQIWIKFGICDGGCVHRPSLQTSDWGQAELMKRKVELLTDLLDPVIAAVILPDQIGTMLAGADAATPPSAAALPEVVPIEAENAFSSIVDPIGIERVLMEYLAYIKNENSGHHVKNKVTHLTRFFGRARLNLPEQEDQPEPGIFQGAYLTDVAAGAVRQMIDGVPVAKKTKRHYRNTFHALFEFAMKSSLFEPTNFRYPNPMSALPTYHEKNQQIIFLTAEQKQVLLELLRPYPSVRMGVGLMIYGGVRRAEALWMTKSSISPTLKFFSVVNKRDEEKDLDSSLKTGQRAVPIIPELRTLLEEYLPTLTTDWLIPSPTGLLWIGENFGDKHREVLRENGLNHTCLHYRHTFATDRAREGWSLFRISKAMGNSVAVCERYYAAFIDPLLA